MIRAERSPKFEMCSGLLEARSYAEKQDPSYAYGPGLLTVSHGPNDFVSQAKVRECATIYALTAAALLRPAPSRRSWGGVLSTNDSGALRLRFGALRDLIIGVTLALPDGTLAKSGGKVVKNVAGYDLPKLSTGALGTLGVITRAVFRLERL